MVCSWLGASRESMVMTFSAARDASVIRKGPMKSGWILFAFRVLVKRTRSLTAKLRVPALRLKYSLLTAAATSRMDGGDYFERQLHILYLNIIFFEVQNRVDIRVCEKVGAHDTLIISVIVGDYTFDHMFTERGFHCNNYWAMGVNNGAVGHFDFTTYWKLEQLLVECAFD
uniref:Uncharacterized protein n=1 Tax=Romanomermis culicivorax TaxID=13658 RepID=A0A915I2J4_ROMCU